MVDKAHTGTKIFCVHYICMSLHEKYIPMSTQMFHNTVQSIIFPITTKEREDFCGRLCNAVRGCGALS